MREHLAYFKITFRVLVGLGLLSIASVGPRVWYHGFSQQEEGMGERHDHPADAKIAGCSNRKHALKIAGTKECKCSKPCDPKTGVPTGEDQQCEEYCHKKHCACKTPCKEDS